MNVAPIPAGFHTVTPYLVVADVRRLLEFLQAAFGAELLDCVDGPEDRIMHAQVRIGDSMVMIGGANEHFPPLVSALYLYVPDTDALYERAMRAGAESLMEPADQFYGDRNAGVKDPSGNMWWIATHIEDVPSDEIARRAQARS
ncbi:MAG: VOC family protein [Pirellulaceae bacterium]|nr:VOC family protein [Pirellulaceae bacterium]